MTSVVFSYLMILHLEFHDVVLQCLAAHTQLALDPR